MTNPLTPIVANTDFLGRVQILTAPAIAAPGAAAEARAAAVRRADEPKPDCNRVRDVCDWAQYGQRPASPVRPGQAGARRARRPPAPRHSRAGKGRDRPRPGHARPRRPADPAGGLLPSIPSQGAEAQP